MQFYEHVQKQNDKAMICSAKRKQAKLLRCDIFYYVVFQQRLSCYAMLCYAGPKAYLRCYARLCDALLKKHLCDIEANVDFAMLCYAKVCDAQATATLLCYDIAKQS